MAQITQLLHDPLWNRQPGESTKAFAAFCVYRNMGIKRSQEAAYASTKPSGQGPAGVRNGRWKIWAERFGWTERAAAWDTHIADLQRQELEEAARQEAQELIAAQKAERKREIALGEQLLAKVEQMLQLPVVDVSVEKESADGKTIVQHFHAAKWRLGDAARIAHIAVELRRLGLDMETSKAQITVDVEDEVREMARAAGWDESDAIETALKYARERQQQAS